MHRNVEQNALTPREALAVLIQETGKGCILSQEAITAQLTQAIEKITDDKIDVAEKAGNTLLSISVSSHNLIAVELLLNQFGIKQEDIINTLFNPTLFIFTEEEKKQIQCKKDFITTQHKLVAKLLDKLHSIDKQSLFDRAILECHYFIFDCLVRHFKKLNQLKSIFEDNEDRLYAKFFMMAISQDKLEAISYATNHNKTIKNHQCRSIRPGEYRYNGPRYDSKTCAVRFYIVEAIDARVINNKDLILYYFQKPNPLDENRIRIAELLVSLGWHEHTIRAIAAANQYNHINLSTARRLVKAYPSRFTPADVFYIVYMGMTEVINNSNLVNNELINSTFLDQSLLGVAIDRNDIDMVRALLVRGASINVTTGSFLNKRKLSSPALHSAIRMGDLSIIKLLLQHGAILDNDTLGLTAIKSANKIVEAFLLAYLHIKYNTKDNRHFNITSDQSKLDLYRIFENSPAIFRESVLALLPPHLQQIVVAKQDLAEQSTRDTSTEEISLSSPAVSSSSVNVTYTSLAERRQLFIDAIIATAPGWGLSEDDVIKKLNAAYLECTDINTPNEEGDTPFCVALKHENLIAIKWLMQKKYLGENLQTHENFLAIINNLCNYNAEFAFQVAVMLLEGQLQEKFISEPEYLSEIYFQLFAACVRKCYAELAVKAAELIDKVRLRHHQQSANLDKTNEIKYIIAESKAERIKPQDASKIIDGITKLIQHKNLDKENGLYDFYLKFTADELMYCGCDLNAVLFLNVLLCFNQSLLRNKDPNLLSVLKDVLYAAAHHGKIEVITLIIAQAVFTNYSQFIFDDNFFMNLPAGPDQENVKDRVLNFYVIADKVFKLKNKPSASLFQQIDDRDKNTFYNCMKVYELDTSGYENLLPKKNDHAPELNSSTACSSNIPSAPELPPPAYNPSANMLFSTLPQQLQSVSLVSASAIPIEINQNEEGQPNTYYDVSSPNDYVASSMSGSIIDCSSYPPAPVRNPQHGTGEFDMDQWKLYPPVNIEQSTSEKSGCLSDYFTETNDFSIQDDDFAAEHEEKTADAIIFAPGTYSLTLFQAPQTKRDSDLIAIYESLLELSNDERFNNSTEGRESAERLMAFAANELSKIRSASSEPRLR